MCDSSTQCKYKRWGSLPLQTAAVEPMYDMTVVFATAKGLEQTRHADAIDIALSRSEMASAQRVCLHGLVDDRLCDYYTCTADC